MQAGYELEALRRIADRLCVELGYGDAETELPRTPSLLPGDGDALLELLSPEQQSLVATVRRGLAKLAAAVSEDRSGGAVPERAIAVALDGAELVMRGQIVGGRADELPALIPSFVFLVTLPLVDHEQALELSQRTSKLIDGALGG